MPRNVRNFWLTLDVDGKNSAVATGPMSKTGGFDLTIKMRHDGGIVDALDIIGRATDDGSLSVIVRPSKVADITIDRDMQTLQVNTRR